MKRTLKEAERYAGKTLPCTLLLTDGPYGNLTWRTKGVSKVLPLRFGCMSPTTDRVYGSLDRVDADIQTWAADGPITEELVSQP